MKKAISIMVILCVAAALFATGTFKVGGTFGFINGTTEKFSDPGFGGGLMYKTSGFGFDVSGKYDISAGFGVWADFNMTFNSDFKMKSPTAREWASVKDLAAEIEEEVGVKAKTSVNDMSLAAGVAVKLPVSAVEVSVGGGVFANKASLKVSASVPENNATLHNVAYTARFINLGVTAYADCSYKINDNFGVGLTIMPRVGLVTFMTYSEAEDKEVETTTSRGFGLSFGMPVVLGASYSF